MRTQKRDPGRESYTLYIGNGFQPQMLVLCYYFCIVWKL